MTPAPVASWAFRSDAAHPFAAHGKAITFMRTGELQRGRIAAQRGHLGNGTLVYSSWLTMHQLGTTDANTCADNDLALVKVDAADVSKVNPSVPFWGSPTGIDTDGTAAGDPVWTDGNTGDLGKELAFARAHSGISGLQLVTGTEPFDPLL